MRNLSWYRWLKSIVNSHGGSYETLIINRMSKNKHIEGKIPKFSTHFTDHPASSMGVECYETQEMPSTARKKWKYWHFFFKVKKYTRNTCGTGCFIICHWGSLKMFEFVKKMVQVNQRPLIVVSEKMIKYSQSWEKVGCGEKAMAEQAGV